MVKAVVQNGVIVPQTPLPPDWREGTEVDVEKSASDMTDAKSAHPTDSWMNEVEMIAGQGDRADDARLEAGIQEVRRREKALARKHLGLE